MAGGGFIAHRELGSEVCEGVESFRVSGLAVRRGNVLRSPLPMCTSQPRAISSITVSGSVSEEGTKDDERQKVHERASVRRQASRIRGTAKIALHSPK